jgi:hypothetical protein
VSKVFYTVWEQEGRGGGCGQHFKTLTAARKHAARLAFSPGFGVTRVDIIRETVVDSVRIKKVRR